MAHILLVDDQSSMRLTLTVLLKQAGHTLMQAATGAEFRDGCPEVLTVFVALEHRLDFNAHDALDDFRIGAVDRELQASSQKRIRRFACHRLQRQNAIPTGGFGVLHHVLDEVLDVGVLAWNQARMVLLA